MPVPRIWRWLAQKTVVLPPAWFKLDRYADTVSMDAADWYFNLKLRLRLRKDTLNAHASGYVDGRIKGERPVFLRDEDAWNFLGFDIGPDLAAILLGDDLRPGVHPLRVDELYFFEKRFPEAIREFGCQFVPGKAVHPNLVPDGFTGPVDHVFDKRMTSAFVRVDLSLPDKILLQHFIEFIGDKRREFRAVGGIQPYRQALDDVKSKRQARLRTFVKLQLLPYLDLQPWFEQQGQRPPARAWADLLELSSEDDVKETGKYAALLMKPFVIDAWLGERARAALRKERA